MVLHVRLVNIGAEGWTLAPLWGPNMTMLGCRFNFRWRSLGLLIQRGTRREGAVLRDMLSMLGWICPTKSLLGMMLGWMMMSFTLELLPSFLPSPSGFSSRRQLMMWGKHLLAIPPMLPLISRPLTCPIGSHGHDASVDVTRHCRLGRVLLLLLLLLLLVLVVL